MDVSPNGNESSLSKDQQQHSNNIVYTVNEAIEEIGFGFFLVLITMFSSLLLLADAMELMLLSVLSPAVKCQWNLSSFEEALMTCVVFFGFFLGGLFWGVVVDIVGRKSGLLVIDLVFLLFGLLSAAQLSTDDSRIPGYPWLLTCRFGVGFGAGGVTQSITYYTEFLPQKARGIYINFVSMSWTIGSMFEAALALAVMREGGLGWHWLLGLSAIPFVLVLFVFPFIPESARFYLVKGKDEKAQKVIERVAWYNCKEVPPGRVVLYEVKQEFSNIQGDNQGDTDHMASRNNHADNLSQNSVIHKSVSSTELKATSDDEENSETDEKNQLLDSKETKKIRNITVHFAALFTNGMWKTTVILLLLWFGVGLLYYGIVLLTTSLLLYDPHCDIAVMSNVSNDSRTVCHGNQLETSDYLKIMWTTAAEFPGLIISVVLIQLLGRKIAMVIGLTVCMIGYLLLFICASDIILTFFLSFIRAFAFAVFQVIIVYTPEVYPTENRALGLGICTAAARIGAMVTPFVAQVLFDVNDYATLSLYASSSLVLAGLAMLLPIETKGRALHDKVI